MVGNNGFSSNVKSIADNGSFKLYRIKILVNACAWEWWVKYTAKPPGNNCEKGLEIFYYYFSLYFFVVVIVSEPRNRVRPANTTCSEVISIVALSIFYGRMDKRTFVSFSFSGYLYCSCDVEQPIFFAAFFFSPCWIGVGRILCYYFEQWRIVCSTPTNDVTKIIINQFNVTTEQMKNS